MHYYNCKEFYFWPLGVKVTWVILLRLLCARVCIKEKKNVLIQLLSTTFFLPCFFLLDQNDTRNNAFNNTFYI